MKNKGKILLILGYVIVIAILISMIAVGIWAFVTYGDKPITEVPSWVIWFMHRK